MFRRTIVSDVVQGIVIGSVLALIVAQIILNTYVAMVNSVHVIGRVLVYSDSDLPTVYGIAKQIQLMPLNQK